MPGIGMPGMPGIPGIPPGGSVAAPARSSGRRALLGLILLLDLDGNDRAVEYQQPIADLPHPGQGTGQPKSLIALVDVGDLP